MQAITNRPIRVALVDDHEMFRYAVAQFLGTMPDIRLVCEAADARDAFARIEETKPDLVLLDVALAGMDGLAVARDLSARCPSARIVILSGRSEPDLIDEAFASGARGYLDKSQAAEALADCIAEVAAGRLYHPPRYAPVSRADARARREPAPDRSR